MSMERKVDASPLCQRELDLFLNAHNAWGHLGKHVLDARESWNWGVLIPALQAALATSKRLDLYETARRGSPEKVPQELAVIWSAFLELVTRAVEKGVKRKWHWEEPPNSSDGRYKVFDSSGILAYLDDDRVRTGFLPFKDDLPSDLDPDARRYALFFECWKKVVYMYRRASATDRNKKSFVVAPTEMCDLMRKVLDKEAWEKLT